MLRSPNEAQRNPGLTLGSIADSAPDFASLHPGYKKTHVIAPCSCRPQGKPSFLFLASERERAERVAKGRFRGRPLARRASRTPFESQRHTGNSSAEASEDRVN